MRVESKTMVFTVVKFLSGSTAVDQNGQWESTDKDAGDDLFAGTGRMLRVASSSAAGSTFA